MGQEERNPALQDLDGLVGEWTMELSNAAFLPDPSATVQAPCPFAWAQDGAVLALHQGDQPAALWLIGRDETEPDYRAFYYDSRRVSRIYRMTLTGRTWRLWREAPGFWQRFACVLDEDGRTMRGSWEKSTDEGLTWEHDFDLTYRRP